MIISSHPYVLAFAGGLLIGLAATIHLLFKGRITGMSGIFYGLISPDSSFSWRSSLVSGLLLTSCIAYHLYGFKEVPYASYLFDPPQIFGAGASTTSVIFAGLFVGLGTRLGSGCTSGHGVCGLPRFSPRSLVAVMTFMATGILTANLKPESHATLELPGDPNFSVNAALATSLLVLASNFVRNKNGTQGLTDIIVSFIVGSIFSIGLMVSGMSRKSKVLGFLTFDKDWDMSLMFVMGGAVLLNMFTFNYIIRVRQKPILAEILSVPTVSKIDFKLIIGAALFGIGWGTAGICPGPAMIVTPMYFPAMAKFMLSMGIGQYFARFIEIGTQKLKTS